MDQRTLPITARQIIKPTLWELTVGLAEVPHWLEQLKPGQFFLAACPVPFTTYLRRAIFPFRITPPGAEPSTPPALTFLFSAAHLTDPGLAWLASRRVGQTVDLLGPLGQGFTWPQSARNILLIGCGMRVEPLFFWLYDTIRNPVNVVLALEASRRSDLVPTHELPPLVEIHLATRDGSLGHRGRIIDHLGDLTRWADLIFAVGPRSFYRELKIHLVQHRLLLTSGQAYVLLTDLPINVCGVGLCTLCTIATSDGLQLACQDGPIFDLTILSQDYLTGDAIPSVEGRKR